VADDLTGSVHYVAFFSFERVRALGVDVQNSVRRVLVDDRDRRRRPEAVLLDLPAPWVVSAVGTDVLGRLGRPQPQRSARWSLATLVVRADRDGDVVEISLDAGFRPQIHRLRGNVSISDPGEQVRIRVCEAVTDDRFDLFAAGLVDDCPVISDDPVEFVEGGEAFPLRYQFDLGRFALSDIGEGAGEGDGVTVVALDAPPGDDPAEFTVGVPDAILFLVLPQDSRAVSMDSLTCFAVVLVDRLDEPIERDAVTGSVRSTPNVSASEGPATISSS